MLENPQPRNYLIPVLDSDGKFLGISSEKQDLIAKLAILCKKQFPDFQIGMSINASTDPNDGTIILRPSLFIPSNAIGIASTHPDITMDTDLLKEANVYTPLAVESNQLDVKKYLASYGYPIPKDRISIGTELNLAGDTIVSPVVRELDQGQARIAMYLDENKIQYMYYIENQGETLRPNFISIPISFGSITENDMLIARGGEQLFPQIDGLKPFAYRDLNETLPVAILNLYLQSD